MVGVEALVAVLEMVQAVGHGHENLKDVACLAESVAYQTGFEHDDVADAAVAVWTRLKSCVTHWVSLDERFRGWDSHP